MPRGVIFVLLKASVGNLSAAKKSSDRRCASRFDSFVSMLAVWMTNSTLEFTGFSWSNSIVPAKSEKRPRTLVMRCRTWKITSECDLSI